ncbi:MAG: riboflavin biosynthesis protein RibF [Paludibacter sp.]|nr:riboflavin biosynthesis protein RibF [Paludibacter sp.]
MQIIYQSEINSFTPCVATVGFFDGVHAGHRFLIEELKNLATTQHLKSVVVTFRNHPRKVLHSDFQPQLITTLKEKLEQLETTGIDTCIVLDFSLEMAKLSAYEFLKTILSEQFNVKTLLVGHDHRFGHNRADGFSEYKQYGILLGMEVIKANRFSTDSETKISSSTIRDALNTGNIELANKLLTYNYSIMGKVINGFKVGQKIGFPTANIEILESEKLVPAIGVYAVKFRWNKRKFNGMMNVGKRPTLNNGKNISIEVNIFDFSDNIYNETVEIDFITKIRDEIKFNNIDELIEQLKKDKIEVLNYLNRE